MDQKIQKMKSLSSGSPSRDSTASTSVQEDVVVGASNSRQDESNVNNDCLPSTSKGGVKIEKILTNIEKKKMCRSEKRKQSSPVATQIRRSKRIKGNTLNNESSQGSSSTGGHLPIAAAKNIAATDIPKLKKSYSFSRKIRCKVTQNSMPAGISAISPVGNNQTSVPVTSINSHVQTFVSESVTNAAQSSSSDPTLMPSVSNRDTRLNNAYVDADHSSPSTSNGFLSAFSSGSTNESSAWLNSYNTDPATIQSRVNRNLNVMNVVSNNDSNVPYSDLDNDQSSPNSNSRSENFFLNSASNSNLSNFFVTSPTDLNTSPDLASVEIVTEPESTSADDELPQFLTATPLTLSHAWDPQEVQYLKVNTNTKRVNKILSTISVPPLGKPQQRGRLRKAGDYLLGPCLGSSPVQSIVQVLARKINTNDYYTMKILTIPEPEDETQDDRQGKMLLHTEHSLLSMLGDHPGVIRMHSFFQDYAFECIRKDALSRNSLHYLPPKMMLQRLLQQIRADSSRPASSTLASEDNSSHSADDAGNSTAGDAVTSMPRTAAGRPAPASSSTSPSSQPASGAANTSQAVESSLSQNINDTATSAAPSTSAFTSRDSTPTSLTGSSQALAGGNLASSPHPRSPYTTSPPLSSPAVRNLRRRRISSFFADGMPSQQRETLLTAVESALRTQNTTFSRFTGTSSQTSSQEAGPSDAHSSFSSRPTHSSAADSTRGGPAAAPSSVLSTSRPLVVNSSGASNSSSSSSSSTATSPRTTATSSVTTATNATATSTTTTSTNTISTTATSTTTATTSSAGPNRFSMPRSTTRYSDTIYTGRVVRRLCLVLDCVTPHEFSNQSDHLVNLQHYVIARRALPEMDALTIFYHTVLVVHSLHERNIVHRDLKLGNLVVERETGRVTLTNLCLGQHLMAGMPRLQDQRGSPAYISPDVLSAQPYRGKPSDMWALGVVLFTMLFGHFPFYDKVPQELFKKIKAAEYTIPREMTVSKDTIKVIRGLLQVDPDTRHTTVSVLAALNTAISARIALDSLRLSRQSQVVPDIDDKLKEAIRSRTRRLQPSAPAPSSPLFPMDSTLQYPYTSQPCYTFSQLSSALLSSYPALSRSTVPSSSHTAPPTSTAPSGTSVATSQPATATLPPPTLQEGERSQQRLQQQLQQLQIIPPNRLLLPSSPAPADQAQVVPEMTTERTVPSTTTTSSSNGYSDVTYLPSLGSISFSPFSPLSSLVSSAPLTEQPRLTSSASVLRGRMPSRAHTVPSASSLMPRSDMPLLPHGQESLIASLSASVTEAVAGGRPAPTTVTADATSTLPAATSTAVASASTSVVATAASTASPVVVTASSTSASHSAFPFVSYASSLSDAIPPLLSVHPLRQSTTASSSVPGTPTTIRSSVLLNSWNTVSNGSAMYTFSNGNTTAGSTTGMSQVSAAAASSASLLSSATAEASHRVDGGRAGPAPERNDLDALIHSMRECRYLNHQPRPSPSLVSRSLTTNAFLTCSHSHPDSSVLTVPPPSTVPRAVAAASGGGGATLIPNSYGDLTPLTPQQLLAVRDLLPQCSDSGNFLLSRPSPDSSLARPSLAPPSLITDPLGLPYWHRLMPPLPPPPAPSVTQAALRSPSDSLSRLLLARRQQQHHQHGGAQQLQDGAQQQQQDGTQQQQNGAQQQQEETQQHRQAGVTGTNDNAGLQQQNESARAEATTGASRGSIALLRSPSLSNTYGTATNSPETLRYGAVAVPGTSITTSTSSPSMSIPVNGRSGCANTVSTATRRVSLACTVTSSQSSSTANVPLSLGSSSGTASAGSSISSLTSSPVITTPSLRPFDRCAQFSLNRLRPGSYFAPPHTWQPPSFSRPISCGRSSLHGLRVSDRDRVSRHRRVWQRRRRPLQSSRPVTRLQQSGTSSIRDLRDGAEVGGPAPGSGVTVNGSPSGAARGDAVSGGQRLTDRGQGHQHHGSQRTSEPH